MELNLLRFLAVKRFPLLMVVIFSASLAFGQLGGSYTYQYLHLPVGARTAALGGVNVSASNDDVQFAFYNPALLNPSMHNSLSVNHAIRAGNINHGTVSYARSTSESVTFYTGLLYNSYGQMPAYDETGIQIGNFSASEYALGAGVAYKAGNLSYGANMRLLFSQLESYNSMGLAIDIGGAYVDTVNNLSIGGVLRNIGTQFTAYTPDNREELPFEIQFGVSKRLQYLPLQLSFTAHNLQQFDLRYDDPRVADQQNIFNADTSSQEKTYLGDKILRHMVVAGEFYFGENLNVRIGYDFLRQREMILTTKRGLTGFSFGAGFRLKRYQIDYGYVLTSLAGGNHYFGISTNLDAFLKH